MHRVARRRAEAAPPVLRFADEDQNHPLGRLLEFVGGQFASSYRVRDAQIMVVNRNFGERDMTITVLDNDQNADGRFLPRSYTVQYWDAKTGQLDRTESVQDRWRRIGEFDLPQSHTVSTASSGGLSVAHIFLERPQVARREMSARRHCMRLMIPFGLFPHFPSVLSGAHVRTPRRPPP